MTSRWMPAWPYRMRPTIIGDDLVQIGVLEVHTGDVLAVLRNGHPVHDVLELLQPVGDVDDAVALGLELVDDTEQLVDLFGGQGGGGFIHDKDPSIRGQSLGYLHHLLLGHRQAAHRLAGVEVNLQISKNPGGLLLHLFVRQEYALAFLPSQKHILRYSEMPAHIQLLVDDGYAHTLGELGAQVAIALAEDLQLPAVTGVDAAKYFHQGGFPRAIFP